MNTALTHVERLKYSLEADIKRIRINCLEQEQYGSPAQAEAVLDLLFDQIKAIEAVIADIDQLINDRFPLPIASQA